MKQDRPQPYDIIGDIHGHADTLRALLTKLGYEVRHGAYRHPERKAIFVGDFIDRGPKIRETLQIVRAMVDAETALAVLGNHEFNAIRYHTKGHDGLPLRPHHEADEAHEHYKNFKQHRATLEQVARPFPSEWNGWLAWFKSLPLFLDLGAIRVVHAAWCEKATVVVGERRFADDAFLLAASRDGSHENAAVRILLNGPELPLPDGTVFIDKEGHDHLDIRARWFGHRHAEGVTYLEAVFPAHDSAPDLAIPTKFLNEVNFYPETEPPVIFGHYWLPPAPPSTMARNAASVDYSVAGKAGGLLAAYRWDGEAVLTDASFVTVPTVTGRSLTDQ